jgi:OmpA-OmpF porin, OOP family
VSRWPAERMALVAAVALAVAAPVAAGAAEPQTFPASELALPVDDLWLTEATLDDSVVTSESARGVRVTLAADTLFEPGRAALVPDATRRLGDVARRIRTARPQEVTIAAHTDDSGSAAANARLSLRRAEAVAGALADVLGAAAPTLDPVGRGERDPVAANRRPDGGDDPSGQARNRRVTVAFKR